MSFLAEQRIVRLHPRMGRLFFANLILFLCCAAVSFFSIKLAAQPASETQWQIILLWTIAGAIAFFFWFLPLLRWMTTFLEVTTTRIIYRSGLFGQRRREVSLSQIQDVELTKGRSITVLVNGAEPLVLTGIPKHKAVAVEIDRLAAAI